jgi:acetoin utilization deacetylase AcuC-like enzyme
VAGRRCGGRIVSMLEGGYDRQGLATGAAAHVSTLMGL